MAELTLLANNYRLDAEFDATTDIVTHVEHRSDPYTGQRRVRYEEKWHRKKFLGQGGFGTVWLEEKVNAEGQLRAVKRIPKRPGSSTNLQTGDEAVIMSILSHRQNEGLFVKFYGWFDTFDSLCLVMEYVEHGDLETHLSRHGPLQEKEAKEISKQLLEGLAAIHNAKLVHSDIKPSNVLVQNPSPQWWVKISDFGISRRMENLSGATFTGAGTRGYKAPEVRFNERTRQTTAIDMWSLGCIVYMLLLNETPLDSDRELARFCKDSSPFYESLMASDGLSEEAKSFIRAILVAKPEERITASSAIESNWIADSTLDDMQMDAIAPTPTYGHTHRGTMDTSEQKTFKFSDTPPFPTTATVTTQYSPEPFKFGQAQLKGANNYVRPRYSEPPSYPQFGSKSMPTDNRSSQYNVASIFPKQHLETEIPRQQLSFITVADFDKLEKLFRSATGGKSTLDGFSAASLLRRSRLSDNDLERIWEMSDITRNGTLSLPEFLLAMHLCNQAIIGNGVPWRLPERIRDEVIAMIDSMSVSSGFFHPLEKFASY